MKIALRSRTLAWAVLAVLTVVVPPLRRPSSVPDKPSMGAAALETLRRLEIDSLVQFEILGGGGRQSCLDLLRDWAELAKTSKDADVARKAIARARLFDDPKAVRAALAVVSGKELPPGWTSAERDAWRRWAEDRARSGDVDTVARTLPAGLAASVRARAASEAGDEATAVRFERAANRAAWRRFLPVALVSTIPLLVGVPLGVWTLVVWSGSRRWTVVRTVGAMVALGALATGVWIGASSGSPFGGVLAAFSVAISGGAIVSVAGIAASRNRHAIPSVPRENATGAPGWSVTAECVLAYLGLYQGGQWCLASSGIHGRWLVLGLALVQGVSGAVAVAYTISRLRGIGLSRRAIGLSSHGVAVDVASGALAWTMLVPAVALAGLVARSLLGGFENLQPNPVLPLLGHPSALVRTTLALMAVVGAPVFEEIFFRGVLHSGLRAAKGLGVALVGTAVVFAALHPLVDMLPIMVLSIGLGLVRERRDSLLPSMVAHVLQNGSATALALSTLG